jgi:vacuolar-type H+-ATPase subunit E/Vma4
MTDKEILRIVQDAEAQARVCQTRIKDDYGQNLAKAVANLANAFEGFLKTKMQAEDKATPG